ncbi:uncharacterized protein N7511_011533 [Penicillium nucicola]|uniref:uncharacterized protein n=1 Tax=Penicillium nucicola TaxID=1850975 RepID=UPI0025457607|nr:uncharacterized protein N7511_011496 [Penicillium nucicola]XP_056978580.1 uncharacterized protein N7511_011533 [Penicillium nucicola]KAJ5742477.1 hypothetical protein N7511_011496 [Penicillium nucicola]KAJ5742514.1 hypothetical protein N7511_011533 [Penicillium nucicola]
MNPIQVIICGKSVHVAIGVKEAIRPTYEALHVITSVAAGISDIPPLLQGQAPPSKEQANLGTQEYGKKVQAIIAGGGYNDAELQSLRDACKGYGNVPWLRHDISKEIDPRQPRPKVGIEYGEQIGNKVVECLDRLRIEGKMGEDGVYWF